MLLDFGELCTITPAAGGLRYVIDALFNDGPRRSSDLDLDRFGPTDVVGSDPHLEVRTEDALNLGPGDLVELESKPDRPYRVATIEPEDVDGGYRVVQLLEA